MLTRFFPKMAKSIHRKYEYALQEMTANKLGKVEVNTILLRKAVKNFSQYVLGYYEVGYNYKKVSTRDH